MVIKIVTDSTADLPAAIVKELDVTVVPEYLSFGDQVYRDQIDISEDEFYQKLVTSSIHPKTAQPTPQDFATVYERLSKTADGIISIHLSNKLSGTYDSAVRGKNMINTAANIEVIDSQSVSIAMGLMVIQAAKMASSGMGLKQITDALSQIMKDVHFLILFDTLKYLAKGGRIGKARAFLGSMLNVKPLLTIKDGELVPSGQVRTRSKGTDLLLDFVKNNGEIEDLAILYSTTPDDAHNLVERLSPLLPKEHIIISRLGSALGVHGGPGVLAVALRKKGTHR
jgi:DegV family protein with EDD domain